jgi:hypothetical protein
MLNFLHQNFYGKSELKPLESFKEIKGPDKNKNSVPILITILNQVIFKAMVG